MAMSSSTSVPTISTNGSSTTTTGTTDTSTNTTTTAATAVAGAAEDSVLLLDDPKITKIMNSDHSVDLLLTRLKQSLITCDELAKFIKKKAVCEDEHYNQMRKIARNTRDSLKHDNKSLRQDSFIKSFDSICGFDEKLYNVGISYVKALTQMYDQLCALSSTIAKSRKSIKEESKRKEKECIDSIQSAEKAKNKYNSYCNELDRLRQHGDRDPTKKTFTLKGSKTSSQQEEDLMRKIENADQDYKNKVIVCKKLKDEMLKFHRPSNTKALKNLILELDTAITAQLQKYSTWNETLFLNSGVTISPLQNSNNTKPSMRNVASSVDNEKDLYSYLIKAGTGAGASSGTALNESLIPVEYQIHPSFGGSSKKLSTSSIIPPSSNIPTSTNTNNTITPAYVNNGTGRSGMVPQQQQQQSQYTSLDPSTTTTATSGGGGMTGPRPLSSSVIDNDTLPPGTTINSKTFGVPIGNIASSEEDLVPNIVTQCIEIIEKYGITLEGIYRTSANVTKLKEMKEMIDNDPANINRIDPGAINGAQNIPDSDIYCIASLLKLFFANLPSPLLSNEAYIDLINAMKIQDDNERYITLHHIVYKLSDESYWTLRSLILHLNRVAMLNDKNKMNEKNLGIVWGPTLMFSDNPDDLQTQSKIVEELIINANNLYRDE